MKKSSLLVALFCCGRLSPPLRRTSPRRTLSAPSTAQAWDGFYIGGFVGGAGGAAAHTTEPLRLDNFNFWFRPFSSPYGYGLDASPIGGLTIGYNKQIPQTPVVLGIEGEWGYLGEYGSGRDVNQLAYSALIGDVVSEGSSHHTSIGSHYGYGLIGGRIGYALDSLLIYVKAAALFTTIDTNYFAVKKEDVDQPLAASEHVERGERALFCGRRRRGICASFGFRKRLDQARISVFRNCRTPSRPTAIAPAISNGRRRTR